MTIARIEDVSAGFLAVATDINALDAEANAATIAAASAQALAERGTLQFGTRSAAAAAYVPAPVQVISVAGAMFVRDVAGTALTTADGAKWSPSGMVNPYHFGAVPDVDVDQSAAFNAMSDFVRTQYGTTQGAFRFGIDLLGRTWRVDSWNLTNIRQPAFCFGNGTIFSKGAGRTVIDAAGTNHARILGELSIEAPDRLNAPNVGLFIGRALFNGVAGPIAPDWSGSIRIDGYYQKTAFANLASEVSNLHLSIHNRSRSLGAVGLIHTGHPATFGDYVGGITSEYATLPTAAQGAHSNILHNYGGLVAKRTSDVTLPILGITQANPVQVTVDATRLTNAEFANGQVVFFHDHGGMPEIKYRRLLIANLNTTAGTFTLQEVGGTPVNGTAFAAWTGGGNMWTSTGPAVIFGPGQGIKTSAAYFLTYGAPTCILDLKNGNITDIELDFQQEAHPEIPIRIDTGSSAALIRGLKVNLLSASQDIATAAIYATNTAGGTLRLDNPIITLQGRQSIGSQGLIGGRGIVSVRNGTFRVPYDTDLPLTGWASFSGVVYSADPEVAVAIGLRVYPISATAAQLGSATHAINTRGKQEGIPAWDSTNKRPVYASNALPTGVWRDAMGAVVITPA